MKTAIRYERIEGFWKTLMNKTNKIAQAIRDQTNDPQDGFDVFQLLMFTFETLTSCT
jgi:hypothetical protein